MIIVKLQGGLGNQLFQYAAGLALAKRHATLLKIDTSYLKKEANGYYTQRHLELNRFEIELVEANAQDLESFPLNENKYWRKLKSLFPFLIKRQVFNERGHSVNPLFFELPAHTYLDGYWQSETYFTNVALLLKQNLRIKSKYLVIDVALEHSIRTSASVSVHIRRGDYVNLALANDFHGLCNMTYYKAAMQYFEEEDYRFFIFSDDLAWCKTQFIEQPHLYFVETENAYTDFYLMGCCQHHIIANSSFSWWAAWLNTNSSKRVIAPKQWFAKTDAPDIYPKDWIRL